MSKNISKTPKSAKRFLEVIGLIFTKKEKGFSRSELNINDSHLNPYDTLHGGVVYSMADTGMGGALSTLLEEDERCSTLEIKINYLKSMRSGKLVCDTKVIHKGKVLLFWNRWLKTRKTIWWPRQPELLISSKYQPGKRGRHHPKIRAKVAS